MRESDRPVAFLLCGPSCVAVLWQQLHPHSWSRLLRRSRAILSGISKVMSRPMPLTFWSGDFGIHSAFSRYTVDPSRFRDAASHRPYEIGFPFDHVVPGSAVNYRHNSALQTQLIAREGCAAW